MILGLDIDNVTGDYTAGIRTFFTQILEVPEAEVATRFPEPDSYSYSNWQGIGEQFLDYHAQAVALGLYKSIPVVEGASEALWKLSDEGHHIRVVTSRFVKSGQHGLVISQTGLWLDKHDIPYRDIMFVKNKADVYADVFLDDAPENILSLRNAGREVVIFDQPYNRDLPGLRVHNWEEAYQLISQYPPVEN
jgi:5'(3')-deoxyribonucleotidase